MEDETADDPVRNAIGTLLVIAGGIMEDESVALVSQLPDDPIALAQRIDRFVGISSCLTALAAAAEALTRIASEAN